MVRRNQNILIAVTGQTGSGKSYGCLRIAELWYRRQFNEDFPQSHICFTVEDVMRILSEKEKKLRKGDLIIFEEAGVNIGSLDFQNKVSKMFTYVLQSFRSMNVGIIMNLPVLTMLNKSARLLLHCHMITAGIDYERKTLKVKPFFHQLNQQSGKVFSKYLRVKVGKSVQKIQRFNFQIPNEHLIEEYEKMKFKFVSEYNSAFLEKLERERTEEAAKMMRRDLNEYQKKVYDMACKGMKQKEIAKEFGVKQPTINHILKTIKKYGYIIEKKQEKPKKKKKIAL